MTSLLFATVTAMHAVLTVWLARRAWTDRSPYLAMVALVTLGLVYDNGIVAVGRLVGEGAVLEALNLPRFLVHALITPLLIIAAVGLARGAGAPWARLRWVHGAFCSLATALIVYGLLFEVVGLELVAGREGDALRYTAVDPSPPIPSIAAIVVLIIVGVALWRRGGGWMGVGAALMFVAAALPSLPLVVTNMGEVALIVGLALTAVRPVTAPRTTAPV
ncbi:hypothetical protein [Nocardiopsis sp. MG754419]|uniref:hypothetical protein n=1 Tax=Nocardiopsis sp. MG754419 TaxID=2259865 RepID=UPI001BACA39A|nr:hypothetical protein [Nocardiopsis sp. MG754419]MBR8741667.1 hypothetical protein [Nocardiopsis sp. MG754419]